MSPSLIIKEKCKICGAIAEESSRVEFGATKLITLKCGHLLTEEPLRGADYKALQSTDGRSLMEYQIEGVKFLEASDGKALLADEQGLGKMVQTAAFLKLHKDELTPCIHVTKTKLRKQAFWEYKRWIGDDTKVQLISSNAEIAVPGFDIYVVSYDILKNDKMFELVFLTGQIKTLIIDECQWIKDHLSGRAKAIQKMASHVEHIVAMSGTPIKNNAGEYFTILNLLKPRVFREYRAFVRDWCDSYETQFGYKIGGLSQDERFHEITKDFILRRTKAEVLPNLPEKMRAFHHVELNPKFNGAMANAMKELEAIYYSDKPEIEHILAVYSKMRKITGLSKVSECVEFVADHVVSTNRKIVVFVHHHDVRDLLKIKLDEYLVPLGYEKASLFDAGTDAQIAVDFETSKSKVLIASTLAAGEGLNLQYMCDAVMLERQWNPANEEQAEDRFHRFGQKNPVTVTYMIASETIDDYFTELVEQKRAIIAATLDGKTVEWNTSSLMTELMNKLMSKEAKAWSMR